MSILDLMKHVPSGAAELAVSLLNSVFKLVRSRDLPDDEAEKMQEEAAMDAAEASKKYMDRKKFGNG